MASPAMAPVKPAQSAIPSNAKLIAAARTRVGAKWFYWIGALSMVNSLVVIFGGNFHFVVGLGITSVVDGLAKQAGSAGTALAIVINGFVAGLFCLFGVFGCKMQKWAFFAGMSLYAVDAVLLLGVQDILGVAFHAYALYAIYRGLAALSQYQAPEPANAMNTSSFQAQ